jgi:type III restriction enzyme
MTSVVALHPNFLQSPYAPLIADERWFPAAEELRETACEKLLRPLAAVIRSESSLEQALF